MADSLRKIDRLIEGQRQLVELATKTDQKADTTAKGVTNVTLKVNQIADDQAELRREVRQGFAEVKQQFAEVNQRFDQLVTLIQERLK